MSQFKKETHLNPAITLSLRTSKNNKNAKEAQSPPDFVIDTLAIKKYISETNKTTYSFRIYPLTAPAQPNEYYNLVYRFVDGQWKTAIFFLLKKQQIGTDHKIFEKIVRLNENTVTPSTAKTASLAMCAIESIAMHCTNTGKCATNGFCDGCSLCVTRNVSFESCASGYGGGGVTTDPNASGSNGSGGGATDPFCYSPSMYENPVYDDPNYINAVKREQIWTNLGESMQIFFAKDENIGFFNESILYQQANNWSLESHYFGISARIHKFDHNDASFEDVKDLLLYQVIVDPSFKKNPCLYGVYKQLGQATTFQNYLKQFDGDFSVANLKLATSKSLANNINAQTSPPSNYLVTITFNENNLNRPALSIARTFIHEMIHAEIFRKLLSVAGQPGIQFNQTQLLHLKDNYPGIYDYYMRFKWNIPVGQIPTEPQHEAMAQHYRSIIEQVLKEYDNSLPQSIYEAIAWEGLKDTFAWNRLTSTEKTNIETTISNFESSNNNCE